MSASTRSAAASPRAFYNEIDPYCVDWLESLMAAGLIPDGIVDSRPIQELRPEDLRGFTQCHFFAGLGGWAYAARLAGWPDAREIWTGSCPCQPFSLAGKKQGVNDQRHLWPYFFPLIRSGRPVVVMGEQTSTKAGYEWLDGVGADLDSEDYSWRPVDIPACSVNAPHIRNRIYWLGHSNNAGLPAPERESVLGTERREQGRAVAESGSGTSRMDDSHRIGWSSGRERDHRQHDGHEHGATGQWSDFVLAGPDRKGKYRRVKPGLRLLAHGIPNRVAQIRAFGNAVVPEEAAEVIAAWMEESNVRQIICD